MKSMILSVLRNPKKILTDKLIMGSIVMFSSSMLSNFLAYLYNLFMGRALGPANFGILTAVVSLLSVISIPTVTFSTAITKFTADYKAKSEYSRLSFFLRKLSQYFFLLGIFSFAFVFIGRGYLSDFLKIQSDVPIIILGILFLLNLTQTVNNGVLAGLQEFNFLAVTGLLSSVLKLGVGVFLVTLGFSVNGAISAVAISILIVYLLSFLPLEKILRLAGENGFQLPRASLLTYSVPVFFSMVGLSLLITTDILLVKRFFSPEEAGLYSALSLVGRVIFYASSSIASVMFPLIAERHTAERDYRHLLYFSLLLIALCSFPIVIFYYLFPQFSMSFFFGNKYISAAPYLWLFGLFITLYSLCNALVNFFLSIKRTMAALLPFIASVAQLIALNIWHRDFLQVITISTTLTAFLLLSLLLYYCRYEAFSNRSGLQTVEDNR